MGTSASSKGPGSGVPMVPPWVPAAVPPSEPPAENDEKQKNTPQDAGQNQASLSTPIAAAAALPSPIAPAGRFGGARLNLGRFASGGDSRDMRRGIQHYVRS